MKLVYTERAIKALEEHVEDLNQVVDLYKNVIKNIKELNEGSSILDELLNAGFTVDQIDMIVKILTK